jgi:hypothetical protein
MTVLHCANSPSVDLGQAGVAMAKKIIELTRAPSDEAKLLHVVKLGVTMRNCQRLYFKHRNQQRLIESKKAEAAFDRAVQDLNLPPNLWESGRG